ncbi:copper chaperone CopZ [Winogradskyella eximia]|jgi:copper chaperone|uniref:Copper chaperone CopZ n=1 Tax=Winogradskyella eximia TaxID=262006 RepID=A0A3D9HCP9_9FLAO|nr:heavy-metal-associated domain-containing protein [Winogradskyella eximia]RED47262.1 copper chaperone CopZ [Winogradskyella eximia]|tara:strand:- start:4392 stop:4661 length:270 start_codon:yes stop_codon:yes gene_type:complete
MKNTFNIQNLKCGGCANTIITQLSKLEGISEVEVNNETNQVSFDAITDSEIVNVKNKLSDLGYPIEGDANSLPKKAKSFVSCAVGRMTK